jgi:hypothetical protein
MAMSNVETRMTNEARMTENEYNHRRIRTDLVIRLLSFVIDSSFWLRHSSLAAATLVLLTLSACSSGGPEPTYPVHGLVTVGSNPLEGGSILFEPVEPSASGQVHSARGTIDDTGRYQLSTFGVGDGAVAGKFHVMVFEKEKQLSDDPNLVRTSIIPDKYHMPETTPLVREVKAEENVIDLEIAKNE